jgi:hypothetical protein
VSAIGITDVLLFGAGVAVLLFFYADVRRPLLSAPAGTPQPSPAS